MHFIITSATKSETTEFGDLFHIVLNMVTDDGVETFLNIDVCDNSIQKMMELVAGMVFANLNPSEDTAPEKLLSTTFDNFPINQEIKIA